MSFQRLWRIKDVMLGLIGSKCLDCGFISYPPKLVCPKCRSRRIERVELGTSGRVVSYTIINVPMDGFENMTPLIIALVEIGGGRVLTQLTNVKPEEVYVGMEVEATIRISGETVDGYIPYVVKFKPKTSKLHSLTHS